MVIWPPTTTAAAAFRLLSSRLRNVWHISRHFFSWKCHRQGESPFVKLSAVRAGARETKQRRKKLEGKEPANNRRTRNGTSQRFMAYHFFFRLHKTTDIAFPFWSVKKDNVQPAKNKWNRVNFRKMLYTRWPSLAFLSSQVDKISQKVFDFFSDKFFDFWPTRMTKWTTLGCNIVLVQISDNNVEFLFLLWSMIGGSW